MKPGIRDLILLTSIFSIIVAADSQANSNELKWYSFDEGMALGNAEGKKIFIHFRADWCSYCYAMVRETFQNPSVVEYMQKNYIPIMVDYDQEKRLVSMFKVKGVPDNWFFSKDGEVISHQAGYIPTEQFLRMLKNK